VDVGQTDEKKGEAERLNRCDPFTHFYLFFRIYLPKFEALNVHYEFLPAKKVE
jgi:hypothetical protein